MKHYPLRRTVRFDCMVDRNLRDRANVLRKRTWPDLIEEKFREIECGFDLVKLEKACLRAMVAMDYLNKIGSTEIPDAKDIAHQLRVALKYVEERERIRKVKNAKPENC